MSDRCINELISTLPKENGWKMGECVYNYQGFWCPSGVLPGVISAQKHFNPRPTDTILCTIPRSGTTWIKALAFAIFTRKNFHDSTYSLFTDSPHEIIPFLELNPNHNDPKIPFWSPHLPYNSLPKSVTDDNSSCKIVYMSRDPKDVLVSLWHFVNKATMTMSSTKTSPIGDDEKERYSSSFSLEEAFELYQAGVSFNGPYWDHVLGYWKASMERPQRVLFMKYEDLKNDPIFHVKRMAKFMGLPFSMEEETKGVVEKIVNMCSFESLSNLEVNKSGKIDFGNIPAFSNASFFRKGNTGDWKNYLTSEMAAKLDQITKDKFKNSGLDYS